MWPPSAAAARTTLMSNPISSAPTSAGASDRATSRVPSATAETSATRDWYSVATTAGGLATWDGDDDTNDVKTIQAALVAGIKVSDMMAFEGGFGWRQDDPDYDTPPGGTGDFDNKEKPWAAYVQGVFTLAPGVYLVPEIGYFDWDSDYADNDAGSTWYAGGKWQIDF